MNANSGENLLFSGQPEQHALYYSEMNFPLFLFLHLSEGIKGAFVFLSAQCAYAERVRLLSS